METDIVSPFVPDNELASTLLKTAFAFGQPLHPTDPLMSKESRNALKSFPGVLLISPISPLGMCTACHSDLIAVPLHLSLLNAILLDLVLESGLVRPFWILILSSSILAHYSQTMYSMCSRELPFWEHVSDRCCALHITLFHSAFTNSTKCMLSAL